jgi:DNA topoisomerase-1
MEVAEAPKKVTRKRTTKKAETAEGEEPAKKAPRKRTTKKAEAPVEE